MKAIKRRAKKTLSKLKIIKRNQRKNKSIIIDDTYNQS